MSYLISIITPVYNRSCLIKRLYYSLQEQSNNDFKWIIVDDGSTDNLDEVVESFCKQARFQIKYIKQKNQGKCAALNKAIEVCDEQLFMVVDSDDYLVTDAIEQIHKYWQKVQLKEDLVGIAAYRVLGDRKISGKPFKNGLVKSTLNALNYHYNRHGELALIYKTSIVKKYPHHIHTQENFLSEEIQYNSLDQEGYLYLMGKPLIVMEYQNNGLTKNYFNNWILNPVGTIELLKSKYSTVIGLSVADIIKKRIKTIIQFNACILNSQAININDSPNKFLSYILLLPSKLYAAKLKIGNNNNEF